MSGYVWYSYGSDVSGPKLAEALGFASGKKAPNFDEVDVLVGWGCKPRDFPEAQLQQLVAQGQLRVLNRPEAVNQNRDKMSMLQGLTDAGIAVPGMILVAGDSTAAAFHKVAEALDKGEIDFPLVGFNRYHRGGPRFCYTIEDVRAACAEAAAKAGSGKKNGVDYFRSFCPGTEYRIHVFRDLAVSAQTKVLAEDPEAQMVESLTGLLAKRDAKRKKAKEGTRSLLPEKPKLEWVLRELAGEMLIGPAHLQRSVGRGWNLQDVPVGEVPKVAAAEAIKALEAAGLDIGAVSVTVAEESARVTNITSAPALGNAQLKALVAAFKDFTDGKLDEGSKSKKKAAAKSEDVPDGDRAKPEIIARLTRRLRLGKITQQEAEEMLSKLEEQ